VGAIFRTAEGVGVSKIYLTGYTPAPVDEFGRANKEIAKTALGAEKTLRWERIENIFELIPKLKTEDWQLIALEQAKNSVDYREVTLGEKAVVLVGNEVEGVGEEILKLCDQVAEIPMRGSKESLNVAVAIGVALFRWLE
jgi:tRNA G18 (ribose-2'-O)-methylase SpoU